MKKLANMALTKAESKKMGMVDDGGDGPKYPYGLSISLRDSSLKKLGSGGIPTVGKQVMVTAMATVTSISMNQQQDGDTEGRVELQITDMAVEVPGGKSEKAVADTLYPGME